jgi:hypothetical protein
MCKNRSHAAGSSSINFRIVASNGLLIAIPCSDRTPRISQFEAGPDRSPARNLTGASGIAKSTDRGLFGAPDLR